MRIIFDLVLLVCAVEGFWLLVKNRRLKQEVDGYKQAAGGLAVRISTTAMELRGAVKIASCLLEDFTDSSYRIPAMRLAKMDLGSSHEFFVTVEPATQDRIVTLKVAGERPN